MIGVLVGVAEIAALLGVTRQRADQLSRQRDFPEPVERVIPLDDIAEAGMREALARRGRASDPEEVLARMTERSVTLPPTPRLWRYEKVRDWARKDGRGTIKPP